MKQQDPKKQAYNYGVMDGLKLSYGSFRKTFKAIYDDENVHLEFLKHKPHKLGDAAIIVQALIAYTQQVYAHWNSVNLYVAKNKKITQHVISGYEVAESITIAIIKDCLDIPIIEGVNNEK